MKELLVKSSVISKKFSEKELDELLDPHNYIGKAIQQVEELLKHLKKKYDF
jgi:adenylosuccinate lyase